MDADSATVSSSAPPYAAYETASQLCLGEKYLPGLSMFCRYTRTLSTVHINVIIGKVAFLLL